MSNTLQKPPKLEPDDYTKKRLKANPGERHQEQLFGSNDQPDNNHYSDQERAGFNTDEEERVKRARDLLQRESAEPNIDTPPSPTPRTQGASSKGSLNNKIQGLFSNLRNRRNAITVALALLTGVTGIGAIGLLIPSGIAANWKETSTRWSSKYSNLTMGYRTSALLSKQYFGNPGCDDTSRWRCATNRGVTQGNLDRLRQVGFELDNVRSVGTAGDRFQFDAMTYTTDTGQTVRVTQDNFQNEFHNNPEFRSLMEKRWSARGILFRGKPTLTRVFQKFNINRSQGVPTEGDEEERQRSLRQFIVDSSGTATFDAEFEEGSDGNRDGEAGTRDLNNAVDEARSSVDGFVENGADPSNVPKTTFLNSITSLDNLGRTLGATTLSGLRGAGQGIMSGLDNSCNIYQTVRVFNFLTQAYVVMPLVKYFVAFAATVDKWKADEITTEEMAFIGDAFTAPSVEEETFGLTFSDSPGYTLITAGLSGNNGDLSRYSAGFSATYAMQTLLNLVGGPNGEMKNICGAVTSVPGQITMTVAGVAMCIGTVGISCLVGAGIGLVAGAAMAAFAYYMIPTIASILVGTYLPDPFTDPQRSYGFGTSLASGAGILGAQAAKANGIPMLPISQFRNIDRQTAQSQQTIAAADAMNDRDAGLFNPKNPMSLTNRLAANLLPHASKVRSSGVTGVGSAAAGIVGGALATITPNALAVDSQSALDPGSTIEAYRGDLCASPGIVEADIAMTGQCAEVRSADPVTIAPTDPRAYDSSPYSFENLANWAQENDYLEDPPETYGSDPFSVAKGKYADFIDKCVNTDGFYDVDGEYVDMEGKSLSECTERTDDTRRFESLTQYISADSGIEDVGAGELGGVTSSLPEESASEDIDIANLYESSESISCASGTEDRGVHDGYRGGEKIPIRVCEVTDIPSSGSESSNAYGFSGATGGLLVNSRISGAMQSIAEQLIADGITPQASSGFRTMQHQQTLYNAYLNGTGNLAAQPGTSNHQLGIAIDIPGATQKWFRDNTDKHVFKAEVPGEPWHWSPDGS